MFKFQFLLLITLLILTGSETLKKEIVRADNRQILLNEKAYFIKGVCYNPVPKGETSRDFKNLREDLKLMTEAGINTIRVYTPIASTKVLDKIDSAGIKVIIGFGYNQNGVFDIHSGSFIDYIKKYKNHKAILFWELGNEYNYHPEWFENDINNWYKALDNAAKLIHETDPSHPVSTAHGEMPDSITLLQNKNIDIWGLNVYRWDNPAKVFDEWNSLSTKPMYLSEAGADSYMSTIRDNYTQGENETAQADALRNILKQTFSRKDICSGLTIFSFIDEWWKAGNPDTQAPGGFAPYSSGVPYDGTANEEYWGLVKINREPKKAFQVVKNQFLQNN
ncbi:glycoside hydrolase family 2 TIM barrel-domain containing protein [Carboxylicivirga caseinilyticus]|uniref:glycoside hydrolase family 2 TIM barrel-domain containing protein n=1 Tax=Carboxylicivirga caseinilyticus TaxID=3417572 RepID=UPI003D32FC1D|nr:hypothetical protein [Marinilabiliaceae bacterium A049]